MKEAEVAEKMRVYDSQPQEIASGRQALDSHSFGRWKLKSFLESFRWGSSTVKSTVSYVDDTSIVQYGNIMESVSLFAIFCDVDYLRLPYWLID